MSNIYIISFRPEYFNGDISTAQSRRRLLSPVPLRYDKENYHELRNVFPESEFVYCDFFDKDKITEEVKDADVAIILGDVYNCLLGENTLKWVACDHAGLNASARDEVFAKGFAVTGAAGRSAPVHAEDCRY